MKTIALLLCGALLLVPGLASASETLTIGATSLQVVSGNIIVPENRSVAGSRTITLPYRVIKADPKRGAAGLPLFTLDGGPGASNLKADMIPEDLAGTRDIVQIGYRGVDGPSAFESGEFNQAVWNLDPDLSEACLQRIATAFSAFVARSRQAGIDLDGYSALEVAADIEALRLQLGYAAIDLYGVSYGTRLCYLYSREFPAALHRVVMIGGNPPGHFQVLPAAIDGVIARYSQSFGRDLAGPLARVSSNMPQRWLWWPIDAGKIELGAQLLLANTETAPAIFDAYQRAARGDGSALAGITLLAPLLTKGMNMADLYVKGLVDFQAGQDVLALTGDPALMGRAFLRATFGAAQLVAAADLPAHGSGDPSREAKPVAAETLVLNGDFDGSTPLAGVRDDLMPLLPHGRLLVLAGYGHDEIIRLQPAWLAQTMQAWLGGQDDQIRALPARAPVDKANMDFALIAAIATGVVIFLGLVLLVLGILIARRLSKKPGA